MRAALLLGAVLASACAPALDWRELRPEGSQARVSFPCRPASHARRVALAGAPIEMSMYSCSVAGTVYALTFADVADPARVGPALDELATAVRGHVQPSAPAASAPAAVRGMTPHPRAANWQIAGRLPDGREVAERTTLFSYGTRVYQATMLGPSLDPEAVTAFFGGLSVGPQ